mgnify:CR=1 FL=1
MAITSDGTQYFGIEASPVTVGGNTYILESFAFNFTATRADLQDSSGEPVGSTIIPGRVEVSGTLQMAANTTPANLIGQTMTLDLTNSDYDGDYLLQDCSVAESAGDYAKLTVNGYRKIN